MMYGYNTEYRTKTVPMWGKSATGAALGCSLITLGLLSLITSIVRMYRGRSTFNLALQDGEYVSGSPAYPFLTARTWTENPFWPGMGYGFWVGLLMIAAGIMGILSFLDGTLASLKAFIALCALSTVFSFYQMITSIIPLLFYNSQKGITNEISLRTQYEQNEYLCATLLIIMGVLATIVSFIAMLTGLVAAGYCSDFRRRRYPTSYPTAPGRRPPPYVTSPYTARPRPPLTARPPPTIPPRMPPRMP